MNGDRTEDDDYFDQQTRDSLPRYWQRTGGVPDLAGQRVLDFGCGHGAMSVQLAQAGADVTGIDLDAERIAYARKRVAADFPDLQDRLTFADVDVAVLDEDGRYDAVFSKDTFEHVEDLDGVLFHLRRLLRPGGLLYAGFSPLYYSPNGAHGRTGHRLPWAHAVLPRRRVLKAAARHQGHPVASLYDLGLNGRTAPEFLAAFQRSGFAVDSVRFNAGDHPLLRVLGLLRRVPFLERFVTVSVYAVLRAV